MYLRTGSSPRMRGAPTVMPLGLFYNGIIPAYAGSTNELSSHARSYMAHPRVCGEHGYLVLMMKPSLGSSPRMRGARLHQGNERVRPGIIPAYAGSTASDWALESAVSGSSPRMRGALGRMERDTARHGIIPAYAGSTMETEIARYPVRDHPRVCGEHFASLMYLYVSSGSSPRMRGAPDRLRRRGHRVGIIPAYAGSTHRRVVRMAQGGDHPRVCGEHTSCPVCDSGTRGSSPRMRGALVVGRRARLGEGIIPAYAGSTRLHLPIQSRCRDHPRVCGEHGIKDGKISAGKGSSPRMRGALASLPTVLLPRGIIPAYAGSTFGTRSDAPMWTGSSPRMRGALVQPLLRDGLDGIIPAYAGSTWMSSL